MANHLPPSLTTTGTDADAKLASLQKPEMAYTERQLVTLIRMMKSAADGMHHELDIIAANAVHTYPEFSKAIVSFVAAVDENHKEAVRFDNERELYQRLFTAEQQKTQALIDHCDL